MKRPEGSPRRTVRIEHDIAGGAPVRAIPPGRDWLQSRLLVTAGVPVLVWIGWRAIEYAGLAGRPGSIYLLKGLVFSTFFALAAFRLRAVTAGAAACGGLICFDLTVLTGRPDRGSIAHSGLTPLLLLFVVTFAATRFRRRCKSMAADEDEERHGRNAAQVIANVGIAAAAALRWHAVRHAHVLPQGHFGPLIFANLQAPMLAALAEATADTVSSEAGQAIGGTPYLLTSFRRVSAGTDGAISALGTTTGIAAAGLIALVGIPALNMGRNDALRAFLAAVAGLFFDSLLGATLERRGWMGNDLVNFASTAFSAAVCWVFFLI